MASAAGGRLPNGPVWPLGMVVPVPLPDDHLGLLHVAKALAVEQLITQLAIEDSH